MLNLWYFFLSLPIYFQISLAAIVVYLFLLVYFLIGKIFRLISLGMCILAALIQEYGFPSLLRKPVNKEAYKKVAKNFKEVYSSWVFKIIWPFGFIAAIVLAMFYIAGFITIFYALVFYLLARDIFKAVRALFRLVWKLLKSAWKLLGLAWK